MKKKLIFSVLIVFLCLPIRLSAQESVSTVSIEQAAKTAYTKDKETQEEIIRFSGNVRISVTKGEKKTLITADIINYSRKRNMLYATGSVVMEQISKGLTTEKLTTESLIFNTSSLEGVFDDGRVKQEQQEALNVPEGSKLIVSADLFARDRSESVTFKNGVLTFCDDENPHWKIKASRIWLLPGNEFAFANALLYVGVVPVMYFPFFYYPKDELIFNPVFGYKPREGYFVQTTTYILGRKAIEKTDKTEKGFNFMQQTQLKEQKLEGLILKNLDANASMPSYFLKIMADYYSTLGGMIGMEGSFKPGKILKSISFDARIGFSNVVFPVPNSAQFTSYSAKKLRHADYGWFFGLKLPFRYGASFKADIQKDVFLFSVSMPFYSDPWFNRDFGDRKESMDWIDFFLSGTLTKGSGSEGSSAVPSLGAQSAQVSGFTWTLSGSYNPNFPRLKPWLTSIRLSSFNSSIVFTSQNISSASKLYETQISEHSPNRQFFYPLQIKPINIMFEITGSLFKWPPEKSIIAAEQGLAKTKILLDKMLVPDELRIQKEEIEPSKKEGEQDSSKAAPSQKDFFSSDTLPDIHIAKPQSKKTGEIEYSLTYSVKPEVSSLFMYSATNLAGQAIEPFDFSFKKPRSFELQLRSPVSLNSNFSWNRSLVSLSNNLVFLPVYLGHPMFDAEYNETEKNRIIINDFSGRKLDLSNSNNITLKPFVYTNTFAETSVSWNTDIKLVRTKFTGTIDKPAWRYEAPKWDADSISSHNFNIVFNAKEGGYSQRLSVQTNLPPLADSYTGSLSFGFPFGSLSFGTGYTKRSLHSSDWYFQPFTQSSVWNFFSTTKDGKVHPNKLILGQNFIYNIDDRHPDLFSLSLTWRGLKFIYEMKYAYSYKLDITQGWIAEKEQKFLPKLLSLSWDVSNVEFKNKSNTISIKPGLSTILSWDMTIPTNSYFSFTPSLSIKINNFLNLVFSASSRNQELLRYLQKPIGFSHEIPGEQNILIDLFNSFAFWDDAKRASSGFKIKSFQIKLEHDLHDWILSSEFKIEPRTVGNNKNFEYKPFFTLSVLWKPMKGLKTVIEDKYGTFTLNP